MQSSKGPGLPLKRPESKGGEPNKRLSTNTNEKKNNLGSTSTLGGKESSSGDNLKDLLITNVMTGLSILDSANKKIHSSQEIKLQDKSKADQNAQEGKNLGSKEQKGHVRSNSFGKKGVSELENTKETDITAKEEAGPVLRAANDVKSETEIKSQIKTEAEIDFEKFLPSIQKKEDENEVRSILAFEKQRIYLQRKYKVGDSKVLTVRIDENRNFLATGSEDGEVRIYQLKRDDPVFSLNEEFKIKSPVTQVRWRPNDSSVNGMNNVLITALTNGLLYYWHVTTSKQIKQIEEPRNEIYAIDVSSIGTKLATAGRDAQVRIYDETKFKQVLTLKPGKIPGHTNRIYATKFSPEDPNMLLTAGWDEMVLLWDLRSGSSERFIYGPLVCGDALDVKDNLLLTGSWRESKQVQLWDLRSGLNKKNIAWDEFTTDKKSFVYSAQFSKNMDQYILAGSTGNFEIRMFDKKLGYKCVDAFRDLDQGVYTLDISKNEDLCVYGGGAGMCGCIEIL